jgi:hypothetical protein
VLVTDPAGRGWSVGRRILPWRPLRVRRSLGDAHVDPGDLLGGVDHPAGLVMALVLAVAIPVVVVLALVLGELLILLVLVPVGLFGRVILRRPWVIEVRSSDSPGRAVHAERVVGWRESGERVQDLAREIAWGQRRTG